MNAPYQRNLAHLATVPGGRRKGANAHLRSQRQKARAFGKEADKLARAFWASHPGFPIPALEERDALCAAHPDFAALCDKLHALARFWGV